MQLAKVIGSMVSTRKCERLQGLKLLVAVPIDMDTFEEKGAPSSRSIPSAREKAKSSCGRAEAHPDRRI